MEYNVKIFIKKTFIDDLVMKKIQNLKLCFLNVNYECFLELHGMISRTEAEFLLGSDDGNFLVRESNNPPGSSTLAIKFVF